MTSQAEYSPAPSDRPVQFDRADYDTHPPVGVQILSVIGFGVFSIVGVSLAFTANWIAGVAVAAIITGTWASTRTFGGRGFAKRHRATKVASVTPNVAPTQSSGNASFDAYRSDVIARLEEESRDFDAFLERLRAARDSGEFDQFMKDRASAANPQKDGE